MHGYKYNEMVKHKTFLSPSHLIIVDQLSFSAGSTLELDLCRRVSPARAVTRKSSGRPSADTQAQLPVIVFCQWTHLLKKEAKCPLITHVHRRYLLSCFPRFSILVSSISVICAVAKYLCMI